MPFYDDGMGHVIASRLPVKDLHGPPSGIPYPELATEYRELQEKMAKLVGEQSVKSALETNNDL